MIPQRWDKSASVRVRCAADLIPDLNQIELTVSLTLQTDESAAVVDAEPSTSATLSPYLKAHKLKLTGTDVPLPLASWGELETRWKVGKWLTRNLEKEGWGEPTPIQRGSMSVLLDVSSDFRLIDRTRSPT